KEGFFEYEGVLFEVIDLPGIYGLSASTIEEKIARNYIIEEKPDLIINIVDGTTLERSLYLTSQLIDSHSRMILVINMYDEVKDKGISIDTQKLEKLLKFPVVPIIAKREKGIDDLLKILLNSTNQRREERIHINYGEDIENSISAIECKLNCHPEITGEYFGRWLAIELLSESDIKKILENKKDYCDILEEVNKQTKMLKEIYQEDLKEIFNDMRLGFINGLIKECVSVQTGLSKIDITDFIDRIVLNKYLSFPIFGIILWLTFQITFDLGGILSGFIEKMINLLSDFIVLRMSESMLKDLLLQGVIAGVGGVLVFLPQIMLLFLIIAFLEDSGYMARIAFIMDKIMHFLGLHGKSFISMFMGIGCNVPGIMAARVLESEDDRKITALINPFMSCSARLPIYILLCGIFFPENGGTIIFLVYITGILVSIITAKFLKTFFFKKESLPFVMELPPYRLPTLKSIGIHMWERASQFLKKMGGVILFGSIIIWALGYYPLSSHKESDRTKQLENSYIGKLGKLSEPIFRPLGFKWKETVALITGVVGKEIVVSTLSVLYNAKEDDNETLKIKMKEAGIDKSIALAFMIFVLLYVPCIATIAAIFKETNSVKWTLFSLFYGIFVAYIFAFLFKNIGFWLIKLG
ncbi:MAG: ferrous iron transport protein B, partial [Brevinematales bacterium]|nr:ferrous iron transport protein B [Brevinematales bacterium]